MEEVILFVEKVHSPHQFLEVVEAIHLRDPSSSEASFLKHLLKGASDHVCVS